MEPSYWCGKPHGRWTLCLLPRWPTPPASTVSTFTVAMDSWRNTTFNSTIAGPRPGRWLLPIRHENCSLSRIDDSERLYSHGLLRAGALGRHSHHGRGIHCRACDDGDDR